MQNNDRPDAEQDGDISDDPRLSAIDRDLASVSKRNDNLLLVILLMLVPLMPWGLREAFLTCAAIYIMFTSLTFFTRLEFGQVEKV